MFYAYEYGKEFADDIDFRIAAETKTPVERIAAAGAGAETRAAGWYQKYKQRFGPMTWGRAGKFALRTAGMAAILPGSGAENLMSSLGFEAGYGWAGYGKGFGRRMLYGAAGAGVVRLGAGLFGLLFSGKDDAYNTIEGLRHEGMASPIRRELTEFGSGYRGPNPWLMPQYNIARDIPRYEMFRASKLGETAGGMYRYMTREDQPSEYLEATAYAGTALHRLEQAKRIAEDEDIKTEHFVYDPIHKISGHIDVLYPGGIPADIKSLSEARMEEMREKGPFAKHVSQMNFYMYIMGAQKGYLEYMQRGDLDETETVELEFDPERLRRDIERLRAARERVLRNMAEGRISRRNLPKTAGLQTLLAEAATTEARGRADVENIPSLEKVYAQEMAYLQSVREGSKFSAMPNRGSFAADVREQLTEFKADFESRWDPLRKIATEIFGRGEGAFEKLINLPEFKTAIRRGLKEGRFLSKGQMSYVTEHAAVMTRHGKEYRFEFVTKRDLPGVFKEQAVTTKAFETEVAALKELGGTRAPSLYGTGAEYGLENAVIMEKFIAAKELGRSRLTQTEHSVLIEFLKEAHGKKIRHTDLTHKNILRVQGERGKTEIAVIDWALANRFIAEGSIGGHQAGLLASVDPLVQKQAQQVLGRKVSGREFEEMIDIKKLHAHTLPYEDIHHGAVGRMYDYLYEATRPSAGYSIAAERYAEHRMEGALGELFKYIRSNPALAKNVTTMPSGKFVISPAYMKESAVAIPQKALERRRAIIEAKAKEAIGKDITYLKSDFYELSEEAVGVGLKQAHNAGRRHGSFASNKGV